MTTQAPSASLYSGKTETWVQDSPVGALAVTVGELGIRSIELGTRLSEGGEPDPTVAGALGAYFGGDLDALDGLPVDLDGRSDFCVQVLGALRQIGSGQVRSYGALAAGIRRPSAARAVGRAVGSNPVPIVLPCHRVVAGNGSLGGYSGGLDVKRWLLAHEGHEPRRAAQAG